MPRRGENIYKRKDGRWEGRYIKGHCDGKIRYGYVYAKTYRDVKERLDMAIHEYSAEAQESDADNVTVARYLFSSIAEEWFYSQKILWKQSSTVKYRNTLNSYLFPTFGNQIISDINREEIISFSSKLLETGGKTQSGLSPKTVTDVLSVLKNVFDYAKNFKNCKVACLNGISVRLEPKALRVFSQTEQQILNEYLSMHLDCCTMGILLCLYTGLRIGEICALKWGDISVDEKLLFVHNTMQRLQIEDMDSESDVKTAVIISSPKSVCSVRKVPIPDDIFRLLNEFYTSDEAFILTGKTEKYIEPRTLENRFSKIIKSCNIEPANFHALRHTFATRCVELGFDIKSLSEILGHASVNITLNRYVHPSMEQKQKNMDLLSNLFSVK